MSAEPQSTYVEGPRPFTIVQDDHRGVIVAVAAVFMVYAYMIIALRLAARIRTMGLDDSLAILATVSKYFTGSEQTPTKHFRYL